MAKSLTCRRPNAGRVDGAGGALGVAAVRTRAARTVRLSAAANRVRKVARRIRKSSGIPRARGVVRTNAHDATHAIRRRRIADNRPGKMSRPMLRKARKPVSRARMKVKINVNEDATAKEVVAVEVGVSEDRETVGIAGRPMTRGRLPQNLQQVQ